MTLKQQAREEFREKMGHAGSSGTFTGIRDDAIMNFIDSLIDRTIAACLAKVPKKSPDWYKEGNWNYCRTLMLEGLNSLQHD